MDIDTAKAMLALLMGKHWSLFYLLNQYLEVGMDIDTAKAMLALLMGKHWSLFSSSNQYLEVYIYMYLYGYRHSQSHVGVIIGQTLVIIFLF